MSNTPIRFDIVDRHTGRIVGKARTRAGATRSIDRRDNAYGACRYHAVAVYADNQGVPYTLGNHEYA